MSSKFWWPQPINRGRKVGGWEATAQPPAKTQAAVFVFGDGIRLACSLMASKVSQPFIVIFLMGNVAYKLFVHHSEDNMIFLI